GQPALAADPRFATVADRVRNRGETVALVSQIMLERTREEWMQLLEEHDIPNSPVHTLGELSRHPHTLASGMILNYEDDKGHALNGVAAPLRVDGDPVPM